MDHNLIQSQETHLPNKWYFRTIAFFTGLSLFLFSRIGWLGLLMMWYPVFIYLVGRGRMQERRNDIMLHGGVFLKRYDRRGV
ncbi:hypothetical protein [Haloarcula vallismortis]|uniref:hypothetical protein n=1 Tax=Haloarcula vallismortis TaxID=28442 RepID=UPI00111349C8|nr:hypothetical protein [Haloarcula vallismortis]